MNEEKKEVEITSSENKKNEKEKMTPSFSNLKMSIETWWKNINKIIDIYLQVLLYAIAPLLVVLVLPFIVDRFEATALVTVSMGLIMLISVLAVVYFFVKAYIAIVLLLKNDFNGEPKELLKQSAPLFWPYIGLSLVVFIIVFLWSLLLIIPGIIFAVLYSMVFMVFFFEGLRGMAALKRSKKLVMNHFWQVLGRSILVNAALLLFIALISPSDRLLLSNENLYIVWNFVVQIITLLVAPITLFFYYNIYKDLKKMEK